MGVAALRARGVSYRVGGRLLVDDVHLGVSAGELLALGGPNGAGKSTLIRLLSGELQPTAGTIVIGDRPLTGIPHHQRGGLRSVMPQETTLPFAFTVREVVAMGRHPHQRTRAVPAADHDAIGLALRAAEMEALAERIFPTLSGGEKGRTTFARILAQQTRIILLDEPTAALDIRHQERVMRTLRALADEGCAIVAALHDLNLAASYADTIGLLHDGALVAHGTPEAVLSEELLSAVFDYPLLVTRTPASAPLVVPARETQRRRS